ncbi:iron chelate uptake ABC transporter family permease subunit, partial [Streptomyces sp. NPDC059578]|uniref:iron chelate uptake ABC transporter family permease subunit n=1 Tax=Streptomyces sp. NPDC059578 TaxID=3346874 RepID=UPI0036826142
MTHSPTTTATVEPTATPPAKPTDNSATIAALRTAHRLQGRRLATICAALVVGMLALFSASVLLGGVGRIDTADVLPAAFGMRTGLADYVIFQNRVPRALAAMLSGALFGLSGVLYQRLVRNPLATPDIVGISAGAGAGATTVLLFAPTLPYGAPLAAIAGSFLVVGLVHLLSWRGGIDTYRLVLVGIGLSGVCTAYTNYLFTVADQHSIAVALRWLVG